MRRHLELIALAAIALVCAASPAEASWIFLRSSYTHDPATGKRVVQYAPKAAYVRSDPTFRQSAYGHNRSSIRVGGSADRLHIVETWGEAIRPYGEWQRPFREGATPYGPWGNPSGPWTTPFGAWVNPYGLGRLVYPLWGHRFSSPYAVLPGQPGALPYNDPGASGGSNPGEPE